ncbi:hypothetical protein GYMLUDRAFT_65154 [Collybiopsis luxurians FD-317 M1]|uniref:Uncharacterized protein n=1 Tax=Collybiopsis luxurians FD-317 M1 TaxID=944289 RepID=A0A0D0BZB4_9AGAR|nr:hypothetical protein GYMLUDRAFT_65154 [Collybiopsis luxurians FD-317 M1]
MINIPSADTFSFQHENEDDQNDNDGNIEYGTKILCLDGCSPYEQLVGHWVDQIHKKWVCTQHRGEHGEPGHCWKDADNHHIGLNNKKIADWAKAIVEGVETIKEPPNSLGIELTCDGEPLKCPREQGLHLSSMVPAQPE